MQELKRTEIAEPIVIIKINRSYHYGISEEELYEVTRGCWAQRNQKSVEKAEYALAVANGEVKEVYSIDGWMHASLLNRKIYPYNPETEANRIGFAGEIAPEDIRRKYVGKSVKGLFKRGDANPVRVFMPMEVMNSGTMSKPPIEPVLMQQHISKSGVSFGSKTEQLEELFDEWEKIQENEPDDKWILTNGGNRYITKAHFQRDGIVDEATFEKEERKILFISNEPNSNDYGAKTEIKTDMRELFRAYCESGYDNWGGKMRQRIGALYKIAAKRMQLSDAESTLHYAVMDLNKRGGGANSKGGDHIVEYCRLYKHFINKELEIIDPDIVIWLGNAVYDRVTKLLGAKIEGGRYFVINGKEVPVIKMWHTSHYQAPKDYEPLPGYDKITGKLCAKLVEEMKKYGL